MSMLSTAGMNHVESRGIEKEIFHKITHEANIRMTMDKRFYKFCHVSFRLLVSQSYQEKAK